MENVFLKKGHIYKVVHDDIEVGANYFRFTALTNCIIFSPSNDMLVKNDGKSFMCDFLITFDKDLLLNQSTSYCRDCHFEIPTDEDMEFVLSLFKKFKLVNKLASFLRGSNFRYNRKLGKIVQLL